MDARKLNALAEQFWQQGYLVLEDFFDQSLMDRCQTTIMSHFGETPDFTHDPAFIEKSQVEVVPWFPQREGEALFDDIENNDALRALSQAILGEGWGSQYCMVMFSKMGTKGQAWHQDCPPEHTSQFNLNRLVYTMDVNDELGGQVYIKPGSHRAGALTPGELFEDFEDQVVLRPTKGTLVLLHGHCWHRIGEIKGEYRVSTNYRAAPVDVPENITDICVYRNMRYQFSTSTVLEEY